MKLRRRRRHSKFDPIQRMRAQLRSVLLANVDAQGNVMNPAGLVRGVKEMLA